MIMTQEQFDHLKAHEAMVSDHQFDANYPAYTTVEQWMEGGEEDSPYEGYYYMCLDIGLDPLEPHPAD